MFCCPQISISAMFEKRVMDRPTDRRMDQRTDGRKSLLQRCVDASKNHYECTGVETRQTVRDTETDKQTDGQTDRQTESGT